MALYFNKNLKYVRKLKGLSQQELADKVGIDRSSISRWESGDMGATVEKAVEIAMALDIPIPEFLGRDLEKDNSFDGLPKTDEQYKKILHDKGLMDDNDYINEEKLDELLQIAEMMKNFNNKKKD